MRRWFKNLFEGVDHRFEDDIQVAIYAPDGRKVWEGPSKELYKIFDQADRIKTAAMKLILSAGINWVNKTGKVDEYVINAGYFNELSDAVNGLDETKESK